jgi:Ca2+-transporting ATPase
MVFVTLGLTQLGLALAVRARGPFLRNPGLLAAVAVSVLAQLAAVALPLLRALLGTQPLSTGQIGLCVLAALVPACAAWLGRKK